MIRTIVLAVCCIVGFHSEAAPWGNIVKAAKTARKAAAAAKKAVQARKAASEAKTAEQLSKAASEAKKTEQVGKADGLSGETAVAADKNGSESVLERIDNASDIVKFGKKVKKKLENDDDGRDKASKPERDKASKPERDKASKPERKNTVSDPEDITIPMLCVTAFMFVVGAWWICLRRRKKR